MALKYPQKLLRSLSLTGSATGSRHWLGAEVLKYSQLRQTSVGLPQEEQ
jgi:hypothetical protein